MKSAGFSVPSYLCPKGDKKEIEVMDSDGSWAMPKEMAPFQDSPRSYDPASSLEERTSDNHVPSGLLLKGWVNMWQKGQGDVFFPNRVMESVPILQM